jgi:DNA processing protein
MSEQALLYLLALQKVSGLGDKSIQKMVKHVGSPQAVFESSVKQLVQVPGINKNILANINNKEHLALAQKELELIEKHNIKTTTWLEESYPEKLKLIPDHPCLLSYKGNIDPQPNRIITIVGTRKITSYGKGFLTFFLKKLQRTTPLLLVV